MVFLFSEDSTKIDELFVSISDIEVEINKDKYVHKLNDNLKKSQFTTHL